MSEPDARTAEQAQMFANRLRKNQRRLRKWARRHQITCYRLYDRDIPELPFAVDWYDGRLYVAEYARPHDREPDAHEAWIDAMMAAAAAALELPPEAVHQKRRARQRGEAQYEKQGETGRRFVVREGGLDFLVNLDDYLDTGLFLDHRPARAMVREAAKGKRVLNLFGYTGAFTVYAAAGGARQTVTVDLSNTYLDWSADNLALNGLTDRRNVLVREDVLEWMGHAIERGDVYDIIVLDPPTFSNSKKMRDVLDLRRDHPMLLTDALALLAPGGWLLFSTNARKFRLERRGLPPCRITDITDETVPEDFRKRPHRAWRLERA